MKVALVSEGTYPYTMGGVSVWCEQLIRGFPDYRWEVVALAVDGSEPSVFARPENLDRINPIPLWGPRPDGRGRPGAEFWSPYELFLATMLSPLGSGPDRAAADAHLFLVALRGMFDYASTGGDLAAALTSNRALRLMMRAWETHRVAEVDDRLTLADALEAAWQIGHMLRPLAVAPVRADIVHSSMNGLSVLVGMAAKWRYGTPLLMSEHGIYLRERYISYQGEAVSQPVKVLMLGFFRSLAAAAYATADAIAAHSSYNRRWPLRLGAHPDRLRTMYNGVAPEEFPVPAAEPTVPTVAFMGRIDPLKDLHTLIRAFASARAEVPDARLRIFGGVPAGNRAYADSCRHLIDELGLADAAKLEGRIDNPVEAYHAGSVVALTSISEGFPYTVIEAMACGRPVVATEVGGVAEAVADTGIVAPARDVGAISAGLVALLRDPDRRRSLGAAARQRVIDNFTLDQSLDAYRRLYEGLVPAEPTVPDATPRLALRPRLRPAVPVRVSVPAHPKQLVGVSRLATRLPSTRRPSPAVAR